MTVSCGAGLQASCTLTAGPPVLAHPRCWPEDGQEEAGGGALLRGEEVRPAPRHPGRRVSLLLNHQTPI